METYQDQAERSNWLRGAGATALSGLKFVGKRLKGGAWGDLAETYADSIAARAEPPKPFPLSQLAKIYEFPTPPDSPDPIAA